MINLIDRLFLWFGYVPESQIKTLSDKHVLELNDINRSFNESIQKSRELHKKILTDHGRINLKYISACKEIENIKGTPKMKHVHG